MIGFLFGQILECITDIGMCIFGGNHSSETSD